MGRRIFLSPPCVGRIERDAVKAAFDSGYIAPCGPQVDEFERRLAKLSGRRYAIALASGTAAIDLFLEWLGVGPGWTVVSPTLSFIATVGPATHRGAKLAFVDSDATGNMDPALLDVALTELTASRRGSGAPASSPRILVIGVDLYGSCCDYVRLQRVCRRHGAVFFVDAAESVGSKFRGRGSGSAGLAAVYSFNGNKTVTTSGGGALLTDDRKLAEAARKLATQSREPVLHYEHRAVGYNYRLSNILAAIGLGQLSHLDGLLARRRRNYEFYAKHLPMMRREPDENHWLNVMLCESERQRDAVIAALGREDIESRPAWKPMHLQPVFRAARPKIRCFGGEVAESIFRCGVCLPSGPQLTTAELRRIVAIVTRTMAEVK